MKRFISVFTVSLLLLTVFAAIALKCGDLEITWKELMTIFTAPDEFPGIVLLELRLPRILAAIFAGGAFAAAGVILQKVLHNELASPDILGVSGGAGCAGIALILFLPQYTSHLGIAAFAGALSAAALICMTAWHKTLSPVKVILAGVALSALFSTVCGAMLLTNPEKFANIMEFSIGGFSTVTMEKIYAAIPLLLLTSLMTVVLPRRLDILSLGKDEAAALGLRVNITRLLALSTAALAAATAVSLAGLLGFVGLISPHIAAGMLDSRRAGRLLTVSPLIGALLTLTADTLGRTVFAPQELPAGIFLSGIGALFFLLLLLRQRSEI